MANKTHYGGVIWTNHALERLDERRFSQHMAAETFQNPDKRIPGKNHSQEFQKQFGNSRVTVIAKQNDRSEWIVLSCWIDPPLPGTKDFKKKELYRKYQKSGFWGRLWITIQQQLLG